MMKKTGILTKNGLTILEIMVVMAIITILAGMLIPGLIRSRRNATRAKCINNLKNIGLICHVYSLDFEEKFPSAGVAQTGKDGLAILKEDYITDATAFICPVTKSMPPTMDYYYADRLTENSPEDSALAADDANRHDNPKNYNILYVDGHVTSTQSAPTGSPGSSPLD